MVWCPKYRKKIFGFISTLYLRYHCLMDSFVGILTAVLINGVSPALDRAWNGAVGRGSEVKG